MLLVQETPVIGTELSTTWGELQVDPFHVVTSPNPSTTVQKEELGQETSEREEGGPVPLVFGVISFNGVLNEVPLKVTSRPSRSTATQNEADAQDIAVNPPPAGSTGSGAVHEEPS
jgi:hypothetical protein